MAAPANRLPARDGDRRRFYTVLVVALVVLVLGGGWTARRAGWIGTAPVQRVVRVPDPPTRGGYLTPVPGVAAAAPEQAAAMSDEELRAQRQRCLAALDMRNTVRYEARQTCRRLLNATTTPP